MKSKIAQEIIDRTPQHTKDFVKMYGDIMITEHDIRQAAQNIKNHKTEQLNKASVVRWFFKTFPCSIGWHKRPDEIKLIGDGMTGECGRCGKQVMRDSQGNWF